MRIGMRVAVIACLLALGGCQLQIAVPPELVAPPPQSTAVSGSGTEPTAAPSATWEVPAPAGTPAATEPALPAGEPTVSLSQPGSSNDGAERILLQCTEQPMPYRDVYVYDLLNRVYDYARPDLLRAEDEHTSMTFTSISADGTQVAWTETYCYGVIKVFGAAGEIASVGCEYTSQKHYLSGTDFTNPREVQRLPQTWLKGEIGVVFDRPVDGTIFDTVAMVDLTTGESIDTGKPLPAIPTEGRKPSPGGAYLLAGLPKLYGEYVHLVPQLLVMDAAAREIRVISSPSEFAQSAGGVTWLDETSFLISVRSDDPKSQGIFRGEISGASYERIIAENGPVFALSADGTKLAFTRDSQALLVLYDLQTQVEQVLVKASSIQSPVFDPTGTYVYYRERSEMPAPYRVEIATGKVEKLAPAYTSWTEYSFDWSANGEWLLMHVPAYEQTNTNTTRSYLCRDGACEELLPPGTNNCYFAGWIR